ncbi:MAG: transcription antitermination factor NusB [Candidatus Cloacimonetes bacterium]|nr:transcription antitermination factor NusB [Candidatus Cloacimonadota bacterium]
MGMRRKAREIALQTMYALEYQQTDELLGPLAWAEDFPKMLAEILNNSDIDEGSNIDIFASELLATVTRHLLQIDKQIASHADNWKFERIATLDRNVMRIAVAEIAYTETAVAIIINEAIEISKKYCSEKSGKFINGILNAIARELRSDEF